MKTETAPTLHQKFSKMKMFKNKKIYVAPMMQYTDKHDRFFLRLISKNVVLFTEMIPSKTLIHSIKRNLIIQNNNQNPIATQVGGSDYKDLIKCSKIAENYNYNEINFNFCPPGGIGRRTGLKILRIVKSVPVQVRGRAPFIIKMLAYIRNFILSKNFYLILFSFWAIKQIFYSFNTLSIYKNVSLIFIILFI